MANNKKRIAYLALAVLMCVSGCGGSTANENADHKEEGNMDTKKLLTEDELIRLSGISEDQYRDVDLEQFIKDFEITEDDIETLNISLLLEEYSDTEPEDVSELLRGEITERTSDFTEGVTAVAFLENTNTDNECVYYDLEKRTRYRASYAYLFSDLSQAEPETYAEGQQLVDELEEQGVFSWSSQSSEEPVIDGQYMVLAVAYDDGTVFRVSADGILSQLLPDSYAAVRDMLLD